MADSLETPRLLLRRWRDEDREAFAAMNADPVVMEHFPAPMTRAQSDALIDRIEAGFEHDEFGLWAVEERSSRTLLGFTGLNRATFPAPFTPAVEVGWRLRRAAWRHGHATEAATAVLRYGFETVGLEEIVSFATARNTRSIAVMERLGMDREAQGDFDHPNVPAGNPIRRHVLYRLAAAAWRGRGAGVNRGSGPPR